MTPLPTPRRLKQLQESGQLKKAWDRAAEAGPIGWAKLEVGSEGEAARNEAQKRTAAEVAESDVPTVMLPPDVKKRLRSTSGDAGQSAGDAPAPSCSTSDT